MPSTAAPSRNVTVPVGTPPGDVTVAVNVTDWPSMDGFRLDTIAVAVPAGFTVRPVVAPLNRCMAVAEKFASMVDTARRRRGHRHLAGRSAGRRRRQDAARRREPGAGQGDRSGRARRRPAALRIGHRDRHGRRLAHDDGVRAEGDRGGGRAAGDREAERLAGRLRRARGRIGDLRREREVPRGRRSSGDHSSRRERQPRRQSASRGQASRSAAPCRRRPEASCCRECRPGRREASFRPASG